MRAIQTGNDFKIYDDSMQIYHTLPQQCYRICFDQRTGFSLAKYPDIEINEKIYGIHEAKVDKVLHTFSAFHRNLGVILSGDKGIGKSLFAKLLGKHGIEQNGLPLIIVNSYFPGIAEYLNSIDQEVMVLFDEFDKTFEPSHDFNPQAEMLTLFDGVSQGKKLFVVTCNDIKNLNGYLINRPGRFHYHFRFEYPTAQDITTYLQDNIPASAHNQITKIIGFSRKVPLNYDCLRAIAFELSQGLTFEDAIADLNIIREKREEFNLVLYFTDGTSLRRNSVFFDSFSDEKEVVEFYDPADNTGLFYCYFTPYDNKFDMSVGSCYIPGDKINLTLEEEFLKECINGNQLIEEYKAKVPARLEMHRVLGKSIHYTV